jgi:hypothetical protein
MEPLAGQAIIQSDRNRSWAISPQQVLVGGGNDPDIHGHRHLAAKARDAFFLEGAQQIRLAGKGMSPISSRKSVPPLGEFELADFSTALAPVNAPSS